MKLTPSSVDIPVKMSQPDRVVLIVDDEPGIREVLGRSLSLAGYQPREAASPIEACRIFGQEHVDAVILDLRMPGLSGFNFLEWLRTESIDIGQTVPVLVLTGFGLTDKEKDTLRRYHAEVFHKPQGMAEIVDRLALVVQLQQ